MLCFKGQNQGREKTTYRLGEISANYIFDKRLVFRVYKKILQVNKKTNPIRYK